MASDHEPFGPEAPREVLAQRYVRSLALSAHTARALAQCRDGGHIEKLKQEIAELNLKVKWQEERIAWLKKPLLVRAFIKFLSSS